MACAVGVPACQASFATFHSFAGSSNVELSGEKVPVAPLQIVVWVSVTRAGTEFEPDTPRFPAIIDTGFNHNLLIRGEHLRRWAGLRADQLRAIDTIGVYGQEVLLRDAEIWLHPNHPGERAMLANRTPFCLQVDDGIIVSPRAEKPRLPLVGLRAFLPTRLHLSVDCSRRSISIRTR